MATIIYQLSEFPSLPLPFHILTWVFALQTFYLEEGPLKSLYVDTHPIQKPGWAHERGGELLKSVPNPGGE